MKSIRPVRPLCFVLAPLFLASSLARGVEDPVPLRNWTPAKPLADSGAPAVLVPIVPCRLVDTRNANGTFGGPMIVGGAGARSFPVPSGPCTGFPGAGVYAWSMNVTVVGSSATTYTGAYLTVWNTGASWPGVSTVNFDSGSVVANAAIVPAGTFEAVSVLSNRDAHLILDVNGYFTQNINANEQLALNGNPGGNAVIVGLNWSDADASHGVGGYAGGNGTVYGVQGQVGATAGVFAAGVHGITTNRTKNFGVLGDVAGYNGGTYYGSANGAGVMGRGTNLGVTGYANPAATGTSSAGTTGVVLSAGGVVDVAGTLGLSYQNTGEKYGVYYSGGLAGFGTKSFVEPHPTDPSRVIRYFSLEGPESGTYFRGSASTADRVARIPVPETFRAVTDVDGLTVQVTPTGDSFVQVRVVRKSLDEIVIQSSRETAFDYIVHGIRRAYRDAEVTPRSNLLRPDSPDARIPEWLSSDEKQRLVTSGIYNPDGSVNTRTAERMGWAAEWRAEATAK